MSHFLTDEQVREEIARLSKDEDVKLARAEARARYRERQKLYSLRNLKKRGACLRAQGVTIEDYRIKSDELDDEVFLGQDILPGEEN